MKVNSLLLLAYSLPLFWMVGCDKYSPVEKEYLIGVSQCSDDAWRRKMNQELQCELIFHPELSLSIRHASDNSQLQSLQIDSFISEEVDLLIVCPNEAEEVKPAVSRAFDAGIPVIVADRQVKGEKYTAFIGGDNYAVGQYMANWLQFCAKVKEATAHQPLQVIEIMGLDGSTPCVWRHLGLMDGLAGVDNIRIMGAGNANWFAEPARAITDSLLSIYPNVDAIVAQNDIMAIAAAEVVEEFMRKEGSARAHEKIFILGTDALTGKGGGVEAILDGKIDGSVTYASRGDLVIQTAARILNRQSFQRDTILPAMLVNADRARTMQLMSHKIDHNLKTINALQEKILWLWDMSQLQRVLLVVSVICIVVLLIFIVVLWLEYRYRRRVTLEREENARIVSNQRQQLESMTAELERTKFPMSQDEQFIQRLQQQVELHLSDSELSVEVLSEALGVSRTQLFRKTKQLTGVSPIELIRHVRLRKAQQLLRTTDANIQQVAYMVGFTSPSYFAKCYKEFFGLNPSQEGFKPDI